MIGTFADTSLSPEQLSHVCARNPSLLFPKCCSFGDGTRWYLSLRALLSSFDHPSDISDGPSLVGEAETQQNLTLKYSGFRNKTN